MRPALALAGALLLASACERRPPPRTPADRPALAQASAPCLILTAPDAADALVLNAGARVVAPRCEVHVASRQMFFAATLNADSRLDVDELCVAGDISRHGGIVSQALRGCSARIDPWLRTAPAPRPAADLPCDDRPKAVSGGAVTLHPGVYCGGLAFNGAPTVVLQPGLYVIRGGDWVFNGGSYRGEGVGLYFADGSKPVFNSGVDLALSAPTDGPRRGVLMDEAPGLAPSTVTFDDARGFRLEGLVHLPSRRTVWNAGSRLEGKPLAVFDAAVLNGASWTLEPPAMQVRVPAAPGTRG